VNRGLAFLRLSGTFEENFIDRAKSIYDLRESSNAGRIQIWHESSGYFFHHPFGVGVANFITSLGGGEGSYDQLANRLNERYNLPNRYISAHSLYLQLLVETGVVGFGLFLSAFGSYFTAVWLYLRQRGGDVTFRGLLVFQVSLLVLWFAFAGMFDVTLFNDKVLIVMLCALSMSGLAMRLPEPKS
jgi:O-antigen ligase